jgi:arginine decarboxylase
MKNTLILPGNRSRVSPARVSEGILLGNRIPKDFFITEGTGQSDITVHAGSYHLALRDAGIEMCNIMTYSSILPAVANETAKPKRLAHGSVMETIMAVANANAGTRATAGIIWGWLFDKSTGERHGGLVCEYNGSLPEAEAAGQLAESLQELYTNGYSVPEKRFGTVLVSLCFLNYLWPVLGSSERLLAS